MKKDEKPETVQETLSRTRAARAEAINRIEKVMKMACERMIMAHDGGKTVEVKEETHGVKLSWYAYSPTTGYANVYAPDSISPDALAAAFDLAVRVSSEIMIASEKIRCAAIASANNLVDAYGRVGK